MGQLRRFPEPLRWKYAFGEFCLVVSGALASHPAARTVWMVLLTGCAIAVSPVGLPGQPTPIDPLEQSKVHIAELVGQTEAAFLLVAEFPTVKVMPDRAAFSGRPGSPVDIALARGEVEAGQVIIAPLDRKLERVRASVSSLVSPEGSVLPDSAVDLAVVGYVHTDSAVDLFYEVARTGWFPDPILPFREAFDLDRDRVQSLWLTVRAPAGQPAGTYEGRITVSPENAEARAIPVRVRVFDFTLPVERSLPVTAGVFPERIQTIYGDAWNDEVRWRYSDFLLAHRLNYDNPYREHEQPPSPEEVGRLLAGGQDAWGLRFIRQPGEGFSDVGPDSAVYDAYLEEAVAEAKAALAVLRQAGAEELAYIYIYDEVREQHWDMLRTVAERLHEELPGVPVMTSAFDPEFGHTSGLDQVVDVWVGIISHFRTPEGRAKAEQARADGARVIWYTTIWPPRPYPNFFIEYEAIEARLLMGAMTQKFRPDGFGYWAINWWFGNKDQKLLTSGPYTDWNPLVSGNAHGEGSWIYAGPEGPITSIRLENFRDGLEDYEYYQLLAAAIKRSESEGVPVQELAEARALLVVPEEIVRSLTEFTRDPELLAQHRLSVATEIERLAARR